MRWLPASLLLVALGASSASAQSPFRLDVGHLHPSAMPESGIAVEGGPGLDPWVFSAAASYHFAYLPLRAEDPRGTEQAVILEHQNVLEPVVALGLPFGLAVQFSWPFVVAASDTERGRQLTLATLRGAGISDPRLAVSWRYRATEDFLVLADATVTIPTLGDGEGAWAELGSEPGASLIGRVGAEGRVAQLIVLRANVGVRGRFEDASVGSAFRVGSELLLAGGIEVQPIPEVHVLAEIHGSTTFDPFFATTTTPFEALAAVRIRPIPDFEIVPFGGVGLGEGYGTPAARAGITLRFYPHLRDADGDGVGDDADQCPGEDEDRDGFEDDDGCPDPDNDGDGVLDAIDDCPNQTGPGRLGGCPDPDSDNDGVGVGDRCPDEPEDQDHFEDEDGCPEPDNDNDGLLDGDDRCPNQAEDRDGFQDDDGCPEPDNDRDGILDADDQCPREPEDLDGFEDEDGCADPDNDGDGIADGEDGPPDPGGHFGVCRNLPETAGGRDANDPDGCPDSAVHVDVAARRIRVPPVFFDTDADVIQERSHADLAYVAELMVANTWIRHLTVEGHTDDRGTDEHNLDLSQRRAASVVAFLVTRGVEAERLDPQGFGRTQPPTADDDPACRRATSQRCRQAARRVVFRITEIAAEE